MKDDQGDLFTPTQIGKVLPPIKPLSLVKRRLIESSAAIEEDGPEFDRFPAYRILPGVPAVPGSRLGGAAMAARARCCFASGRSR